VTTDRGRRYLAVAWIVVVLATIAGVGASIAQILIYATLFRVQAGALPGTDVDGRLMNFWASVTGQLGALLDAGLVGLVALLFGSALWWEAARARGSGSASASRRPR